MFLIFFTQKRKNETDETAALWKIKVKQSTLEIYLVIGVKRTSIARPYWPQIILYKISKHLEHHEW